MTRILFITPYYPPEKGAAAVRVSETATRLVRRGHQVMVLTTVPNYPTGIIPSHYRGRLLQEEDLDGVQVIRVWSYVSPNKGFLRRIVAQLSFGCLAPFLGGNKVGHPDVIIVESHPLFNAIAGRILARWKHCPFIFMVSDLWPASAVQLGVLRQRVLIRLAEWLERSTYKRASLIWALSEGIRSAIIQCGLPPERVFLLTNGVDLSTFRPLPQWQARAELGWDNRFTVVYAGTFGLSHGLTTVLEAARQIQDRVDIHFIFVGDGSEKADLLEEAQRCDLKNVTFVDAQPHERMPLVLAGADVCLVPMRNLPLFEGRLPLKMFEVMACARPMLLGVEGEARRLAEQEARAALYVEPENAEALLAGILYLREHQEEAKVLGLRGRAYVEARFDRDQLTAELDMHIARLLGKRVPVSTPVAYIPESFSPQTLYQRQEVLSKNEMPYSKATDLIFEKVVPDSIEGCKDFSEALQKSQTKRRQAMRGRQSPSPAIWHLILVSGDVILLVALFASLLFFHVVPQVSSGASGIQQVNLIWISLALVSWGLAVGVTQSQYLRYASNRFKSPCYTLFILVLMCIFWIPLSHLLLGVGFVTLAGLELFCLALAAPVFATWRFLLAEVMHLPRFRPRAVIVGVNSAGETLAKELQRARHSHANVLGYIGESTRENSDRDGLPVFGGRGALRYLVSHSMIDVIIMALEYGTNPGLFKEAIDAGQLGITVLPMAVVYEGSTGKIPVEHVGDQWYVALQSERTSSPLYLCWKKVLDLVCGAGGLLILCLVLPVIALFIYLDSPGPIFYSQKRVGLRGKAFRIYKFRTMCPDAEGEGHAVWAAESDKRVTRVGRFLRATHVDELPQLFNILRGDMSLIGPRPERAEFISELEKTIPFYGYRLTVKPGLTGWAQVKYRYGRTGNDALIKLQYDLYYIKRRSFILDLFIILKTVAEVLSLREHSKFPPVCQ